MSPVLPARQLRVLRYLGDSGSVTVRDVTVNLRMGRPDVQNALRLLSAKGLASADSGTWPASFAITTEGREALAGIVTTPEGGDS